MGQARIVLHGLESPLLVQVAPVPQGAVTYCCGLHPDAAPALDPPVQFDEDEP